MLEGDLPKKVQDLIREWAALYKNDIMGMWDTKTLKKLPPQFPIYKALEDAALFNLVQVDCGGCSIAWNADIDISRVRIVGERRKPTNVTPQPFFVSMVSFPAI